MLSETSGLTPMDTVTLESVSKFFRHRPALWNWLGAERRGVTRALSQVSLRAAEGDVLVILGPNGSGKTTLLKLVSTMLLPDEGRVRVCDADTADQARQARRAVGFAVATERSFFPRLTARENLDFFAALEDIPRVERPRRIQEALDAALLADVGDTLVMKFSSGMYQRLGIARALLKQPAVLLLDEPTRSLDPGGTWRLWQLLRRTAERGATILLATHNFEEAATIGQHVVVLRQGEVAAERRVGHQTSIEDLRSFYFREIEPEAAAVPGEVG